MSTHKNLDKPIPVRMKLVTVLVIFLIKMIAPWEYGHQFREFWQEIKELLKPKHHDK